MGSFAGGKYFEKYITGWADVFHTSTCLTKILSELAVLKANDKHW
jgi:hypothetical protein